MLKVSFQWCWEEKGSAGDICSFEVMSNNEAPDQSMTSIQI
jgi:hypothetical protein